jgi:hypothetical protein
MCLHTVHPPLPSEVIQVPLSWVDSAELRNLLRPRALCMFWKTSSHSRVNAGSLVVLWQSCWTALGLMIGLIVCHLRGAYSSWTFRFPWLSCRNSSCVLGKFEIICRFEVPYGFLKMHVDTVNEGRQFCNK